MFTVATAVVWVMLPKLIPDTLGSGSGSGSGDSVVNTACLEVSGSVLRYALTP